MEPITTHIHEQVNEVSTNQQQTTQGDSDQQIDDTCKHSNKYDEVDNVVAHDISTKAVLSAVKKVSKSSAGRYKKFITCCFPKRLDLSKDQSRFKYEITIFYHDVGDILRKKRIRFGSQFIADIRDIKLGKDSYKKKYLFYKKKYVKFLIETEGKFDARACQEQAWPLQKNFWSANYCWSIDKLGSTDEYVKAKCLDEIVETLQQIPDYIETSSVTEVQDIINSQETIITELPLLRRCTAVLFDGSEEPQ